MARDNSSQEEDFDTSKTPRFAEPQYRGGEIAIYRAFMDKVYKPSSVLYPCCDYDASPSAVFDNVTYVDTQEAAMELFRKFGLKAFGQDIRDYKPTEEHDLLILLNPAIETEWATQHLRQGGYILLNDYHGNATDMFHKPDKFTLWGVIDFIESDRRKNDNRTIVSRNLESLFEPVADGDELRILRPDIYEFVMRSYTHLLRQMNINPGDRFEDIYFTYKRIMGQSEEELPAKRVASRYIFVKK